mgnify:CR=1 FL=1
MEITDRNKDRYIRYVLKILIRYYSYKWLGDKPFNSGFIPEAAVNKWSTIKINPITPHFGRNPVYKPRPGWLAGVILLLFAPKKIEKKHNSEHFIYNEIRYFNDIKDLLNYLAPKPYYTPGSTLIYISRQSKKINIKYKEESFKYFIEDRGEIELPDSKGEMVSSLKTFFRSYALLLLDMKKEPLTINQLYQSLLDEEIQYMMAKNSEIVMYLIQEKNKTIKEILKTAGQNSLKSPSEIFRYLITHDYNRFTKLIDDYYLSKKWDDEIKFKAYLKIYDKYYHENKYNKANQLGDVILDLLDSSGLNESKKNRIKRLIQKNMKGGS